MESQNSTLFNSCRYSDDPYTEPVFVLRGSDMYALAALETYFFKINNDPSVDSDYKVAVSRYVDAFKFHSVNYGNGQPLYQQLNDPAFTAEIAKAIERYENGLVMDGCVNRYVDGEYGSELSCNKSSSKTITIK